MRKDKKLTAIVVLFIIAVIALGLGIYFLVRFIMNAFADKAKLGNIGDVFLFAVPILIYFVCFIIASLLNFSYRSDNAYPGKFSDVLVKISYILFVPFLIFAKLSLFFGNSNTFQPQSKEIKVKDDKGNERTLTPTYSEFTTEHYEDGEGEEWKSYDGGKTFEHVVTKATVKDELGNEYNLRAVFAGSSNFIDQNGDAWYTNDGGKTFERK
ncbi:MAG: hypothetical protein NC131_17750 [Roseburia sp.]|nr:hypothetical protein [Roseburia sp.]